MVATSALVPRAFVWRKLHSLTGFLLVVFILEHLLTNSQAALWIGDDGSGFVRAVNFLHNLPYLQAIEVVLLGIPIVLHGGMGIRYAIQGKSNVMKGDGSKPAMGNHSRNRAYTLQRLTSWVVLIGIILHVVQMRFMDYPTHAKLDNVNSYFVKVHMDDGLYPLSKRLGFKIYNASTVADRRSDLKELASKISLVEKRRAELKPSSEYDSERSNLFDSLQRYEQQKHWIDAMTTHALSNGEVVVEAMQFGDAVLLTVRDTFKSWWMSGLYTLFVLATCFHAFNGLWTFCISWGVIVRMRSQSRVMNICWGVMGFMALLGLVAIWGTYWINLRS